MTEETLVHLLGNLTPKQWAEALKDKKLDTAYVKKLIYQQEGVLHTNLMEEVQLEMR